MNGMFRSWVSILRGLFVICLERCVYIGRFGWWEVQLGSLRGLFRRVDDAASGVESGVWTGKFWWGTSLSYLLSLITYRIQAIALGQLRFILHDGSQALLPLI